MRDIAKICKWTACLK